MERLIEYNPDEAEIWQRKEPRFRVRLDEPFTPFAPDDFEDRELQTPDFYMGLSFTLKDFGVGQVVYSRYNLFGFNRVGREADEVTPLGPATISYLFTLSPRAEGIIVPPLDLTVHLFGRLDRYPPDTLLEFPSYSRAVLCRWEGRIHDPELHELPIVMSRKFLLPEWQEISSIYLPENPKVLSDLRLTFIST